jgi:hypothetical protein
MMNNSIAKEMKKQIILALAAVLTLAACNDNDMLDDQQPVNPQNNSTEPVEGPTVPLNVTAFNGDDGSSTATPRTIAAERTASGATLTWESTDKIKVFLGSGMTPTELTSPTITNENKKAIFSGDVATGGQTVTESTPVYSYVASDYMTFNSSTNDVTIDLTAQNNQTNTNGSIRDAVLHNFFYASTTYGDGNVTFNYENKLAIMELVLTEIAGENGTGTVTFTADQGIPSSVTFDLETGNVKSVDTANGVTATNVLFINGEAKCYVAIVPNASSAITNAKVRITVNGHLYEKVMKNTNIAAGSLMANQVYKQTVKKALVPIGSWLFSDGTWGEKNVPAPDKTIVGVVYENEVTAEDAALGYTHGYAIALKDITTGSWWSGMNLDVGYGYLGIKYNDTAETAKATLLAEPSGLKYSADATAKPDGWTVHAPKLAYEYIVTANMHSFLPSAGHIYRMLMNLGALSPDADPTLARSGWASEAEEIKFPGTGSTIYQNLGQSGVLNIDAGMTSNAPINGNFTNDEEYWTSSQCDNNEAYCFTISPSVNNWIYFDGENKPGTSKTTRACIAF